MRRVLSLVLAALLAIGVAAAIVASVRDRVAADDPPLLTTVRGVIGSEKQPFFRDPAVAAVFARHGLQVQVDTAGSREIATRVDLDRYDFAFPAGIPAAERIRRERKVTAFYQPFYTPMAVGTFKPIAKLLAKAGVASPLADGYWRFDMRRYLDLVARKTRWNELPGNTVYPARKSMLIASTDVRTSNSAAMYLAVASYLSNGERVVENAAQGDKVVDAVAPLFLGQGFSEYSSEGPFEDYLTIGIGKTPMVMIYEAQYLARAAARDGSIDADRVLMYPEPTVLTKHTLVPLQPAGDQVGRLLVGDPELQRLAVRYGFRTADRAMVRRYLAEHRVAPRPTWSPSSSPRPTRPSSTSSPASRSATEPRRHAHVTDRPTSEPADPVTPDAAPAGPATVAEPGTELILVPPAPVASVNPAQAATVVPVDPAVASQLEATADAFADSVAALDVHSPDFTGKVGSISRMGDREMRDAAAVSNRMLERPVKAMGSGLFDAGSPVSRSLIDLRNTVEELDPARQGDLFSPRKLLGMIPMGSKLRDYFDRYRSSQTHLDAIINALYRGQDELRKDNAAIEQEKVNLWATMGRLQQYALMAARLDQALEDRIAGLEATDRDKARMLRQDVQFYARQKHQDLLTQLAVAVQGYLALDLVRKNNHELIKGVDRATTTTVAALRTAVMVAQALANQRLVLDQITALNTTTGNLIESTSSMLRQQTGRIHDQAASATINLNQLKTAFANIYATMEAVDTYKDAALQSMRTTVDALEAEVGKARGYLERAKRSPAVDDGALGLGSGELALPAATGGS